MDQLVSEIVEQVERRMTKTLANMKREIIAEVMAKMNNKDGGNKSSGGELVRVSDKQMMVAVSTYMEQNYPVMLEPKIKKTIEKQVVPQIDAVKRKIRDISYDPSEEMDAYRSKVMSQDCFE